MTLISAIRDSNLSLRQQRLKPAGGSLFAPPGLRQVGLLASVRKSVAAEDTWAGLHIVPLQAVYSDLTEQLHSFKYFFLPQSHKPFI